MTDILSMFIPITKVDAAKRLVYGVATAEAPDRAGEVCDYASTKPLYEKWSSDIAKATDGKSFGNLRSMHSDIAAGKLTAINFNDKDKAIEICAKVVDDAEWNKVQEGVYTGFSQGGAYVKRWKDEENPELTRYTAKPYEVSLVDLPCLETATFEVIKTDGTSEMRKFVTKSDDAPVEYTPSATEVAAKAVELAKVAGDVNAWAAQIEPAIAALKAAHAEEVEKAKKPKGGHKTDNKQDNDDAQDEGKAQDKSDDQSDEEDDSKEGDKTADKAAAPELAQVWRAKDGSIHETEEAAKAANEALKAAEAEAAKAEAAKAAAAPAMEVLSEITKVLDKREGKPAEGEVEKADYNSKDRKKMADSGEAMKDGSFPIKTAQDVKNAVKDWGRTGSKSSVKRHIIRRAKAIGATSSLPSDWPGSTASADKIQKDARAQAVEKGLQEVAMLAMVIQDLDWLASNIEFEAMIEEDGSMVPNATKQAVENLCGVLREMVAEETEEISEGDDVEFFEMAAGRVSHSHFDALVKMADKLGKAKELVEKVGARHSKADQERIQKAHDHLVEAGAECAQDDEAEKAANSELAKVSGERDALTKAMAELQPVLKDILERVKRIEEQPAQGTPSVFKVVGKEDDQQQEARKLLEGKTPDEIATLLFKAAQVQGRPLTERGR